MKNPLELLEQVPPQSLEAESGVLASMLIDPRCIDEVAGILKADRFHSHSHRTVYEAALRIHNGGKVVDFALLIEDLKAHGKLEAVGGLAFLDDLFNDTVPIASNAVWYAGTVKEKAELRDVINAAADALRDAHDPQANSTAVLSSITQKLIDISEQQSRGEARPASEFALEGSLALEERLSGKPEPGCVGLPWCDASRILGRFRRGNLIILAARTSAGKSALAYNLIDHAVEQLRIPTILFSFEMSGAEVTDRMVSSRSGVSGEAIRDGNLSPEERRKYVEHASDFEGWPFLIDDNPNRTMLDIATRARMYRRQGKLGFLVIDHIGLIERDNARESDYEHMSKVSRRLKLLARELDIPVLGLAQLNRESDKRADPKPKLSDIKASGSIEQDANVVMFIHRPELYAPDDHDKKGKAELHIAKNRGGKTGVAPLRFDGRTTTFVNAVEEWSID